MLKYNNKKEISPQELGEYIIVFSLSAKKQSTCAGDMETDISMS